MAPGGSPQSHASPPGTMQRCPPPHLHPCPRPHSPPATCPPPAGSHHLAVHVTGTSLMARLLRSTIGALNTSSQTQLETSNFGEPPSGDETPPQLHGQASPANERGFPRGGGLSAVTLSPACLPQPRGMTRQQYVGSCLPLAALVLLCLAQVYTYRLRRAIASFYFPKVSAAPPALTPGVGVGGATRFLGWPPLTVIAGAAGEETCALLLQQAAAAAAELRPPAAEAHCPAGTAAPGTGERGGGRGAGTALGCRSRGGFAVPPIPGLLPHGAAAQLQPHTAPAPPQGTSLLQWCRQRWPRLRRWMRRSCTVCGTPQTPQDRVCPVPACGAPYCRPCWREVGSVCLACTPGDPDLSRDSSEDDAGYAA